MDRKELVNLFKLSFKNWRADNPFIRAAALTFFIILPLPSLLLIAVSVSAVFIGQTQATQLLVQLISAVSGPVVAGLFRELLAGATSPFSSVWSAITVIAFSLAGAVGAFAVLRDTMNVIWEAKMFRAKHLSSRIKHSIGPFFLVSSLGLIVIAWNTLATTLFNAIKFYSINRTLTMISLSTAQVLFSFSLSAVLFAIIYKVLPDRRVHWVDVPLSALVTAAAFTVANYVIGFYVETFTVTTIIGAAGALFVILLWIYVLNQIVLFGAELSKVWAQTYGPHPNEHVIHPNESRILKMLEEAEEKIEAATKGLEEEEPQSSEGNPRHDVQ